MKKTLRAHWKIVVLILVVLLCVLVVREFWYAHIDTRPSFTEEEAITLTDYSGGEITLSEYEGDVVVVYSWASWCPFCREGLQTLSGLSEEYDGRVTFVAVNRGESRADALGFTETLNLSKKVVLLLDSEDSFYKAHDGYAMPEIMFITKRGKIALHQRGPLSAAEIREKVADMFR